MSVPRKVRLNVVSGFDVMFGYISHISLGGFCTRIRWGRDVNVVVCENDGSADRRPIDPQ